MAIYFLFMGFVFALTIVENAADMSCHLSKVKDKPTKFILRLWSKDIIRNCQGDTEFDAKKCRCDKKKLKVNPIVNGYRVHPSEVPWCVMVGYKCPAYQNGQLQNQRKPGVCTGVLVGSRWVLTAKHCYENHQNDCTEFKLPPSDTRKQTYYVEAGIRRYSRNEGENVDVQKMFYHDTETHYIDIMLLQLEKPIQYTKDIQPIPVAQPGSDFFSQRCTIAGFGRQNRSKTSQDEFLYMERTTLLEPSYTGECIRDYGNIVRKDWMICAKDDQHAADICSGDSGGAVVCPDNNNVNTVAGILSIGDGTCEGGNYAIYADVRMFYKQMMDVIDREDGSG